MPTTPTPSLPRPRLGRAFLLPFLLVVGPALPAAAGEAPPILWEVRLDGAGTPFATDVLTDLAVNAAGEICATGANAVESGAVAATTVFYEADGSERWRHTYTAPESAGNEEGLHVFLGDDGRCRVAGRVSVQSPPSTGPDVLVLEYEPQGGLAWSASHDGEGGFDVAVDVTADAAGNVYVAALSAGDGTGWDMVTLKYDADGEELWARRFDGPIGGDDQPVGLAVDGAGNVHVAGTAAVTSTFGDELVVIQYDAEGDEVWTELVDGGAGGTDRAADLVLDSAGNIYVAALLLTLPGAEWHAGVVKLLPDGTVDWTGTFGHPVAGIPEEVHSLVLGTDGSVYLLATGSDDVLTARFDAAGSLAWDHLRDSASISDIAARPLAVDGGGNAYVAATDFVPGSGFDFLLYQLEATDGAPGWERTYGETGEDADDRPAAVVVDPVGDVIIGGTVNPGGESLEGDWAIVKYGAGSVLFADGFESGDLSAWSSTTG
jgi:hypothetical protein